MELLTNTLLLLLPMIYQSHSSSLTFNAHFFLLQIMQKQALRQENQELHNSIESILQEIENQKEINGKHETEIQTLLQFNDRLLSIIQNQVHTKKDGTSLQQISQQSECESELLPVTLNSLMKNKIVVERSQRGDEGQYSLIDRVQITSNVLTDFLKDKEELMSVLNKSYEKENSSYLKLQNQTAISPINSKIQLLSTSKGDQITRMIQTSKKITQQMNREITEFKKYRKESASFYDEKIKQVKNLSSRINKFKPMDQIKHITQKLTISKKTTELINRTLQGKYAKQ